MTDKPTSGKRAELGFRAQQYLVGGYVRAESQQRIRRLRLDYQIGMLQDQILILMLAGISEWLSHAFHVSRSRLPSCPASVLSSLAGRTELSRRDFQTRSLTRTSACSGPYSSRSWAFTLVSRAWRRSN